MNTPPLPYLSPAPRPLPAQLGLHCFPGFIDRLSILRIALFWALCLWMILGNHGLFERSGWDFQIFKTEIVDGEVRKYDPGSRRHGPMAFYVYRDRSGKEFQGIANLSSAEGATYLELTQKLSHPGTKIPVRYLAHRPDKSNVALPGIPMREAGAQATVVMLFLMGIAPLALTVYMWRRIRSQLRDGFLTWAWPLALEEGGERIRFAYLDPSGSQKTFTLPAKVRNWEMGRFELALLDLAKPDRKPLRLNTFGGQVDVREGELSISISGGDLLQRYALLGSVLALAAYWVWV